MLRLLLETEHKHHGSKHKYNDKYNKL